MNGALEPTDLDVAAVTESVELLGVLEDAPADDGGRKPRRRRVRVRQCDQLVDVAHGASIGNSTAQVNGYLTGRDSLAVAPPSGAMLGDVVARVEKRLKAVGLSASAASRAAGLSEDAIRNMRRAADNPSGRQGVSTRTIAALAPVLKTTAGWLLNGEGDEEVEGALPAPVSGLSEIAPRLRGTDVVGEVQGGAFKEAVEYLPEDRYQIPVALPGYEGVTLRALKVVGPSVNELYPDGTYVIVVSTADTDARHGDRVVVYRSRGELREATIKEVRVEPDGRIGLWPRSTHQDFQEPIFIEPDADPESQDLPEIAFVVVGSFRKEERPPPPIRWRKR